MKAWQVSELGEPQQVLQLTEVSAPAPGRGQVLVRVLGSSLGFPDVLICRGEYQDRPALPFVPGAEICGLVLEAGPGARFAPGDRVVGLSAGMIGGLAECAVMDDILTFAAPPELTDAQAATLFSAYGTGWFGLHRRAHLAAGEVLLVQAAAGGVGLAAVQLGLAAGATVIGVVRGERKAEAVRSQGAHLVIDKTQKSVVDAVKSFTGGHGADVVYDPVGGESYTEATKCIAFEGRILIIGFAGGTIQTARLNHALLKNYSIQGLHFSIYTTEHPAMVRAAHDELLALVHAGAIAPVVGREFAFSDAALGLQTLAGGGMIGRAVVTGDRG